MTLKHVLTDENKECIDSLIALWKTSAGSRVLWLKVKVWWGAVVQEHEAAAVGPLQDQTAPAFCALLPVRMWIRFPHTEFDPQTDVLLQRSGMGENTVCACMCL